MIVVRTRAHQNLSQIAALVAGRVRAAVGQPLTAGGTDHRLAVSVGIALAGLDADPDDLLRRADQAMYHSKTNRKDRRRQH